MNIDELRKAANEARDRRAAYMQETDRQVLAVKDARLPGYYALDKDLRKADAALDAALDAERLAAAVWPYPEGTVFEEWESVDRWSRDMRPSGKLGRIELVTPGYDHGAMDGYRRQLVGRFVIRHLKKDGSRGARYSAIGNYDNPDSLPWGWRVKEATAGEGRN